MNKWLKTVIILCVIVVGMLYLDRLEIINEALLLCKINSINKAMNEKDIEKLDHYCKSDTQLIYNTQETTYAKARNNISQVFKYEKEIRYSEFCSHNYGINKKSATFVLITYVIRGDNDTEMDVKASFKKTGPFNYKLVSLESNQMIFQHVFIDRTVNIDKCFPHF